MLLQGGSALRLPQTDDAILEANLGDVLLFLHDAAHPQKTVVASAYTHNVYYTLFTDAGGSHTQIMKGAVDAVAEACAEDASHLATLSTARKHRLWNLSPSNLTRPLTRGAMTLFRRSSQTPHVGNEKNPCSDAVCGNSTTSPDCASVFAEQSLLVKDEDAGKEEKEKGLENWSLTNDVAREQEVLLVAYGKGAPPYVKDCLRIEKHSITLSMPDARYELSIDDTNTPAMFSVDTTSGKRSKVVWSRASGTKMIGGELQTVFPAALIFYPEARRCLDTVIIGLVAWQQKMLSVNADAAL